MTELQAKEKIQKLMAIANCSTANSNEAATAKAMASKVAEKNNLMTWFFLTFISNNSSVKKEAAPVKLFTIDIDLFKPMIITLLTNMAANYFDCMIHDKGTKNFKAVSFKCTEEQFKAICKAGSELTKAFRKYRKAVNEVRTGSNKTYEFKKLVMDGFYNKYTFGNDKPSTSAWVVGRKINVDFELSKKGGAQ